MKTTTDILIVGGGVIGLSIAVELAQRGTAVTVLSRDFKQGATQAAAGMLAPQAEALPAGPMLDLCLQSRALYPNWIRKLEGLTGLNSGYWPCGILAPIFAEEIDKGVASADQPQLTGGQSQWLDQTAIHQHQPGLNPQVAGGWWFPQDGQVDNRALAQVLWAAAVQLGVKLCEGITVEAIQRQGKQVVGLETSAGTWQAEQYVLASGAWSAQLLTIPITPRKGQMLSVQAIRNSAEAFGVGGPIQPQQPLQQILFGTQIYVVPRLDGRIAIGATSEDVGFTPHNTPAGIHALLAEAVKLYPELQDFPTQEFWWGFRPATPDECPILGAGPWDNLIFATGHYRNGILLAPVTAALLADLILAQQTDPLLEFFSWQRFR